VLNEFGVACEEDKSLLVSRKISLDGKNICKINGANVTVSMLKKIGQALINVHGQMDNHNLLNEELHYTYIDSFAENSDILEEYLCAYNNYCNLKRRYDNLIVNESEKARKIDLLTYQIKEIEDASIKIGEWDELEKRKKVLEKCKIFSDFLLYFCKRYSNAILTLEKTKRNNDENKHNFAKVIINSYRFCEIVELKE
jgi:DNA repair protein RecN (Recombination protein N)